MSPRSFVWNTKIVENIAALPDTVKPSHYLVWISSSTLFVIAIGAVSENALLSFLSVVFFDHRQQGSSLYFVISTTDHDDRVVPQHIFVALHVVFPHVGQENIFMSLGATP